MKEDHDEKISRNIGRMIDKKRQRIRTIQNEIKELQEICPHSGLIETPGADTGNWDRNDDEYWTDYKCPHCGKQWRKTYVKK